jgi:hypothetical protein
VLQRLGECGLLSFEEERAVVVEEQVQIEGRTEKEDV